MCELVNSVATYSCLRFKIYKLLFSPKNPICPNLKHFNMLLQSGSVTDRNPEESPYLVLHDKYDLNGVHGFVGCPSCQRIRGWWWLQDSRDLLDRKYAPRNISVPILHDHYPCYRHLGSLSPPLCQNYRNRLCDNVFFHVLFDNRVSLLSKIVDILLQRFQIRFIEWKTFYFDSNFNIRTNGGLFNHVYMRQPASIYWITKITLKGIIICSILLLARYSVLFVCILPHSSDSPDELPDRHKT